MQQLSASSRPAHKNLLGQGPTCLPSLWVWKSQVSSWDPWVEGGSYKESPNLWLEESHSCVDGSPQFALRLHGTTEIWGYTCFPNMTFSGVEALAWVRNMESVWMRQVWLWNFLGCFSWVTATSRCESMEVGALKPHFPKRKLGLRPLGTVRVWWQVLVSSTLGRGWHTGRPCQARVAAASTRVRPGRWALSLPRVRPKGWCGGRWPSSSSCWFLLCSSHQPAMWPWMRPFSGPQHNSSAVHWVGHGLDGFR